MPVFTTRPGFPEGVPENVISLVPAMTESLIDFRLTAGIVGVSDSCPWEGFEPPCRVGDPTHPDLDRILALRPDLVLADREITREDIIRELDERGARIWLTFSQTTSDVLGMLADLVHLFQGGEDAHARLRIFEASMNWARMAAAAGTQLPYFCPIGSSKDDTAGLWWMTFTDETYSSDLLSLCGGRNVFAGRRGMAPLDSELNMMPSELLTGRGDQRYLRVTPGEVRMMSPELILIPDAPYAFGEQARAEFPATLGDTPAGLSGRIVRIDGRDITWKGTRAFRALARLPEHFQVDAGLI
ncbi:MAG: ABC transporter substrate-binding protein [Anaerolineales bacterium]|nr:ABC transporter substrate-binding protein [Anaerolineales bacterium]